MLCRVQAPGRPSSETLSPRGCPKNNCRKLSTHHQVFLWWETNLKMAPKPQQILAHSEGFPLLGSFPMAHWHIFIAKRGWLEQTTCLLSNSDTLNQIYFEVGATTLVFIFGCVFSSSLTPFHNYPLNLGSRVSGSHIYTRHHTSLPSGNFQCTMSINHLGKLDFLSWKFGIGTWSKTGKLWMSSFSCEMGKEAKKFFLQKTKSLLQREKEWSDIQRKS